MEHEHDCDCDEHYPDELTELLDNVFLHTTMCFPQVIVNQETVVMGYAELSGENSMRMIATDSVSTWTAICTHCGWTGSVSMEDNIPAWEQLPDTEGGESEDTE